METTSSNNGVLPEDILFQILIWLPVVSLLRFKSVCKSWLSFIQSPRFISQHYNRGAQEDEDNYNNHKLFCLRSNSNRDHHCKIISFSRGCENLEIPEYLKINDWVLPKAKIISCKGIICLRHEDWNVSLWNPATKQFRILPKRQASLIGQGRDYKSRIGFGFDVQTNDYKVVCFLYSYVDENSVEVYSLSTNSWKKLDNILCIIDLDKYSGPKMPFRNGEIYCWIGLIGEFEPYQSCIISFNFTTELFGTIPLPDDPTFQICARPQLAILRGDIAIINSDEEDKTSFQIWVMNEYGVKHSWTRLYTIGPFSYLWESIGFAMNGNFLMSVLDQDYQQHLCLCDPVTQQITNLPGQDSSSNIGVAVYKECLISV